MGTAARHATALGLHLRVTDDSVSDIEKTTRARTWYSIYSLEVLITEITGRPKSIFLTDVTIPIHQFGAMLQESLGFAEQVDDFFSPDTSRQLWLDHLQAGRNISQMTGGIIPWKSFLSVGRDAAPSYLSQRLSLCRLSDKVASELYVVTSEDSWYDIQQKISSLQTDLRQWADNLPQELVIQGQEHADSDLRTKIELAMYYHSVEMMLHRPCLAEVVIENESTQSQEFNRSSARACVHAAMSMLALMPAYPTAHEAYQLLPWWTLLHSVAQAMAVILLELALEAQHFRDEIPQLATCLRKAFGYLWCMTEGSLSAYRAWRIFRQLLTELEERHGDLNLRDIPTEALAPDGWNEEFEELTARALLKPQTPGYQFQSPV